MAVAGGDSRVSAGKKMKRARKKQRRLKVAAHAVTAEPGGTDSRGDAPARTFNPGSEPRAPQAAGMGDAAGKCSVEDSGFKKEPFSSDDEAREADNEDDAEPSGKDSDAESTPGTNSGWADAMAKILGKKIPKSKPTILVKNKELEKEKEKLQQERLEKRKQLDKKREWEMLCRVKPDVVRDKETERNLQRIATRGVVQLFNAVQKHQKNVGEKVKEAGGSVRKRAKLISSVSKKDFISVLRGMDGNPSEKSSTGKNLKAEQGGVKSAEGPGWTILRDDFMMGASMKDWDKESDGQGESHPGSAGDDSDT